jgi:outer membrane protein assembly factor BamB
MKRALCGIVLLVGIVGAWALPASAAETGNRYLDAVLDIMPDMQYRFEAVDELVAEKKWDRVLQKLDEIVDEAGETVWSADGKIYTSVSDYVRHRIMSLPADGLAFYRVRYDGEARALLEEGLRKQSTPLLDQVDLKYPASIHAGAALDASASVLIDHGRYVPAVVRLERLLARPKSADSSRAATRLRAMALAKLGFCQAKLGDLSGARRISERLKKDGFRGKVTLGGGQDALVFIKKVLDGGQVHSLIEAVSSWPAPGGHADHARPMIDLGPNLSRRWTVKIGDGTPVKKQPVRRGIRSSYNRYGNQMMKVQVSPMPVVDREGVVYVNTGTALYAFDHITGRQRWVAKPRTPAAPKAAQPGMFVRPFNNYQTMAMWYRWQGATTASVGGGRVYAVEIMGVSNQALLSLGAFDASSGKRVWSFDQTSDSGEFKGQAYFPWAPRYDDGRLIGIAIHRDQTFLVSLDAATGKVQWKLFLAADPVLGTNAHYRRTLMAKLGQPVMISDGVAYVATGMGAVAAVEARTGQLRWIAKYPRTAIKVTKQSHYTQYSSLGSWSGGMPMIERGKLYLPAWDSKELLVFDCGSGRIERTIPRGDFTHFIGVRDGVVFLSGRQTVALDAQTGLWRWTVPTPFDVQGLPVLTESAIVIPTRGGICSISLAAPVFRRLNTIAGADTKLAMGNVVSCDGRLIASNTSYVTGYFSYEETYAYLSKLITKQKGAVKPLLDRGDLSYLHASASKSVKEKKGKFNDALRDFQSAEKRIVGMRPADKTLVSRLNRAMYETRLKLSEVEKSDAVTHIDIAKKYIYNDTANIRYHLARGAALAAEKLYADSVDEYLAIVKGMSGKRLSEDEASVPVEVIAQGRIGDLVKAHGVGIYARVDAKLKPGFGKLVAAKSANGLHQMQLNHPHSSLADNCLLEVARIVAKEKYGAMRSQVLLRSIIQRYDHSEVLGQAYTMLLQSCETSKQLRLGAITLRELGKKHPNVQIAWEGKMVKGSDLAVMMLKRKEYAQALTALNRTLPLLMEPLKKSWNTGKGTELLANVVSDESCFDRGIGLAVDCVQSTNRHPYIGRSTYMRAFSTTTGETMWKTKLNIQWSYGAIESGVSQWTRNKYRSIVVCSGGVVAACHPEGIMALDMVTGKKVWSRKWKKPASNNPARWFGNIRMNYRIQNIMNQRPTFASEAGRIFYLVPDGTLVCLDAATGRDIWRSKQGGYAAGKIGMFGDVLVTASVSPNQINAYSAVDGKRLYKKTLPGTYPQHPTFDRARNRVMVSDGASLHCYNVADYKLIWKAGRLSTVNNNQPWIVRMLPDNRVLAAYYGRNNNYYGYKVSVLDGTTGKRKWSYQASKYKNDRKGNYTRSNLIYEPMFTRDSVLIPMQNQVRKRSGKRYTNTRDVSIHTVDLRTGKKKSEFAIKAKTRTTGNRSYSYVYFLAGTSAAGHSVTMTRQYTSGKNVAKLSVINTLTGKEVLSQTLPAAFFSGRYQQLLQQRIEPYVTIEGSLLVPTGSGIQCYSATPIVGGKK